MIEDGLGDFMNGVEIKELQRAMMNQGNELKTAKRKTIDVPELDEDGNLMKDASGNPVTSKVTKDVYEDDEEKILDWLWDYGGAVEEDGDLDEIDYDDMQADMDAHGELDELAAEIEQLPTGISDWGQEGGSTRQGDDEKQQPKKKAAAKSPAAKKGPTTKPGLKSKVKKTTAKRVAGKTGKRTAGTLKKKAAGKKPSVTKSPLAGKKKVGKKVAGKKPVGKKVAAKKAPAGAG